MKKRWLGLVLVLILVVALCAACGEADVVTGDDVPDEEEFEENIEETMAREAEEAAEEETNSGSNIAEDELAVLRVTEEMAREAEGVYLKRGENYYTFGERIPYKTPGVSYNNVTIIDVSGEVIFYDENLGSELEKYEMYSFGDIPVPVLKKGDLVIGFYNKDVPNCKICNAEFVGYSICLFRNSVYDSSTNSEKSINKDSYELKDSAGNLIEDYRRLKEGENYILSWYDGSQYKELDIVCDGRTYDFVKGEYTEIPPQFTQEGYVIYDLSSLPSGLYRINSFGLVEIE